MNAMLERKMKSMGGLFRAVVLLLVLSVVVPVCGQTEENELVRDPENKYLVWTTNVKVVKEGESADTASLSTAVSRSTMFFERYFPYLSMCNWQPGMRFMVIPEKRDMVVRTFADMKTRKLVGNMSLRYKTMVYDGVERNDVHDRLLFHEEESGHAYFYDLPTRKFEEYCFTHKGVPTLAYLGDVDSAAVHLMGKQLETVNTQYNVDVTTTSYGYDKIPVHKGTIVTVKGVGVGSHHYPVKLIVEDDQGNQFFQNVMISGTNSGVTEEELRGTDDEKHLFESSFRLLDEKKVLRSKKYSNYINKSVVTLYPTTMMTEKRVETNIPRLTELKIVDISAIVGSDYFEVKFQKDSVMLTKMLTFERRTSLTEDVIKGVRDDYFGTLFRIGTLNMEGIREANMQHIRERRVMAGFTEEEVLLALGEPDAHGRTSRGTAYTWIYKSMINREQCVVYFNSRSHLVTTVRK